MGTRLTINDPARYRQDMALPASLRKARALWEDMRLDFVAGVTSEQLRGLITSTQTMAQAMAGDREAADALGALRLRLTEYLCQHHLSGRPATADERAFETAVRHCYEAAHRKIYRVLDDCPAWELISESVFQTSAKRGSPSLLSAVGKSWDLYWRSDVASPNRASAANMLLNFALQLGRQDLVDLLAKLAGKKAVEPSLHLLLAPKLDEIDAWVTEQEHIYADELRSKSNAALQVSGQQRPSSASKHRRRRRSHPRNAEPRNRRAGR